MEADRLRFHNAVKGWDDTILDVQQMILLRLGSGETATPGCTLDSVLMRDNEWEKGGWYARFWPRSGGCALERYHERLSSRTWHDGWCHNGLHRRHPASLERSSEVEADGMPPGPSYPFELVASQRRCGI